MDPSGIPDVAGLRAYAESLEATFNRMQAEAPAAAERARALQVTEKSRDGFIAATVGARGELIRLDIDPRIYRNPDSRELADTILETIKRAGTKVQEQIIEVFEPIIPREQLELHMSGDLQAIMDDMAERMHRRG